MVKVPVSALFPLPSHVGFQEAAATQMNFGTAWHALVDRAGLRPDHTVLVHAAGLGTGAAAIQVGHLTGATVFATAGADWKLEKAQELGATHMINYNREDVAQKVMDLREGRGVDIVVDIVGGEVFTKSLQCLSPNPPKDTDGRREDSGRGWVRELQGRWPGLLG